MRHLLIKNNVVTYEFEDWNDAEIELFKQRDNDNKGAYRLISTNERDLMELVLEILRVLAAQNNKDY
jgi:phosphoribosylaminoimidazole carboxylase (NCAIR synthetase)